MPLYEYVNPNDPEEKMILLQTMHEEHSYTVGGVKWDRVWTVPQIAMDTKFDTEKKFLDKTAKGGTMGDLWEMAGEASEKRAEKNGGIDPVKENFTKKTGKKLPKKRTNAKDVKIEIG